MHTNKLNMSLEATVEGHIDVSLYIKIMTSADFQAPFLPVTVIAHVGMLLRFIPFTCSHDRLRSNMFIWKAWSALSNLVYLCFLLGPQVFPHEWCSQDGAKKTFLFIKRAKVASLCACQGSLAGLTSCETNFCYTAGSHYHFSWQQISFSSPPPPSWGSSTFLVATFSSPSCDKSHLALFHS